MRVVGEAQFKLGDMKYASETWEWVPHRIALMICRPNLRSGTIYQKLGDLVRSDEALNRTVKTKGNRHRGPCRGPCAARQQCENQVAGRLEGAGRHRRRAKGSLRSPFLLSSLDEYRRGFETDPSHYYSGLNALAMATMLCELAAAQEEVWRERYEDEDDGGPAFERLREFAVATHRRRRVFPARAKTAS
jgi:hypothetical protein